MPAPKKIFILGGPGSGKSYIAEKLSATLKITHTKLDDIYWQNDFKARNPATTRDKLIRESASKKQWIIEGAYCAPWIYPALDKADSIILIKTSHTTQRLRLIKRIAKRMYDGRASYATSRILMQWVSGFDTCLQQLPQKYHSKITVITGKKDADAYNELYRY